jgi:hypothetical protein
MKIHVGYLPRAETTSLSILGIQIKHSRQTTWTILKDLDQQSKKARDKIQSTMQQIKELTREDIVSSFVNNSKIQSTLFKILEKSKKQRRFQLSAIADMIRGHLWLPDRVICLILKARLQLVGNHLYATQYKLPIQPSCPRDGCDQNETVLHIFNACPHALGLYKKRHDSVSDVLNETIKLHVVEDEHLVLDKALARDSQDLRRPDISYAKLSKSQEVQVGEYKVPFDTNLKSVFKEAKSKYSEPQDGDDQSWIQKLQNLYPEDQIRKEIAVFAIGSLGTIHSNTAKELEKYDIAPIAIPAIIKSMARKAILGSYEVWRTRTIAKFDH